MKMQPKDFQRLTAQRVYELFHDHDRRRVLVADEVGLGKTIVARQVIELVRDWHENEKHDNFFHVVYICSNANIAAQNISKLGIESQLSITDSRLSMQHLQVAKVEHRASKNPTGRMPENIEAMTPSTSFRVTSGSGTAQERALIYAILCKMPEFQDVLPQLNEFLSQDVKDWNNYTLNYIKETESCGPEYINNTLSNFREQFGESQLKELKTKIENRDWDKRDVAIGKIRHAFARVSIQRLDPDLVIIDEFQRFSSLLAQGDDDMSMLTAEFFDPKRENTKILLLSATPYKPFSTLEEINAEGADEHYDDFMRVVDFLIPEVDEQGNFHVTWRQFNKALTTDDASHYGHLIGAKTRAEDGLYGVMCRTERFNDGIIAERVVNLQITDDDVLAFAEGQKLLDSINCKSRNMPIEYVKSAPYLLTFMDNYILKKNIISQVSEETEKLAKTQHLKLDAYLIGNYKRIPPANAKLQMLHDEVFGRNGQSNAQMLLWMPASRPYYSTKGVFNQNRDFSKILIFSAWEMVPRMIAAMMTYYAEYYTLGAIKNKKIDPKVRYEDNKYGQNRLRGIMQVILEYPCHALAHCYEPSRLLNLTIAELRKIVGKNVRELIAGHPFLSTLPIGRTKKASQIVQIMQMLDGKIEQLEEMTALPSNLFDVLTDIAIASPAVCAWRISGNDEDATKTGDVFVKIFNRRRAAAIIDLLNNKKNDEDAYYVRVLDYCVDGNMQAVLDEYAHFLGDNHVGKELSESYLESSTNKVETFDSSNRKEVEKMRIGFAWPFINKAVSDESVKRSNDVRKAFNSPLAPFILASTSIGQEGLDFHHYASKIIHWNLPSNPVDLEQREGRVNRYHCLAVRRNVAHLFGADTADWNEMFRRAEDALKGLHSEMVPHWCLPTADIDADRCKELQKIERIVPLYPLSADVARFKRLKSILALYRMTMGHPRQEEMLNLLANKGLSDSQMNDLALQLSPFARHKNEASR